MRSTWMSYVCLALAVFAAGCGGEKGDGLKKFPGRGVITVNGKPQAGLIVRLIGNDSATPGTNARYPVGVTNDQGEFQLSTNGDNDGGVAGDYGVVVVWPENNEPPLKDRLNWAFSTPEKSKLQVTIQPAENVFDPIDLKFDAKAKKSTRSRPE